MNLEGHAHDDTLPLALQAYLQHRTKAPVALRETHISWVLLTKRTAFKLKKPVRLPFVDFSTPALRHHYCLEELRLNRRFAPALYRAVLPVRGSVDAPTLGDRGAVIDHVLSKFGRNEIEPIREAIERSADAVEVTLADGFEAAMNRFNPPPAPE